MTDPKMVEWQYMTLLGQLDQIQLHAGDPSCPCSLSDIGEYCLPKHSLSVATLAAETAAMDEPNSEMLYELQESATEMHKKLKDHVCGEGEDYDVVNWAREWRKKVEPIYYSCSTTKVKEIALVEALPSCDSHPLSCDAIKKMVDDIKAGHTEAVEYWRGYAAGCHTCANTTELMAMVRDNEPRWCFGVKTVDKQLGRFAKDLGIIQSKAKRLQRELEIPIQTCKGQAEMFATSGVLDPYGSRCRDPKTGWWITSDECNFQPTGIKTIALGIDGVTQYELEFRVISLDDIIVSHDPFTFTLNSKYPKELQPRLRERAATKVQVEKIAADLEPDALLTDFHVIDRGAPIVGPDMVVESGNGRIMGIIRAESDYPDKYQFYKDRLKERIRDYGLRPQDVDSVKKPVLVRVRLTEVDRKTFAQEANTAATISPSAIENARTDAERITLEMLSGLQVGENESLEDSLRAPKNNTFARRFLGTLPENVQAALLDSEGRLNRDGVHRMAMAIFVSAFKGDSGLRLAEKAFETLDMDVRNVVNAISRSLGTLAKAEALTYSGDRDSKLSIGDDLAQTVIVYSAIKHNPVLTVDKYLNQTQMFGRELTLFQEEILKTIDNLRRSPRKLATVLTSYADSVISAPPPAQTTLIPGVEINKEDLWAKAIKQGEKEESPALFEQGFVDTVISGIGIGLGWKGAEWLVNQLKGGSKTSKEAEVEAKRKHPYSIPVPSVDVYPNTIEKHYRPASYFHKGSIRVMKPTPDTMVYIGCPKSESWHSPKDCSKQEIVKTIVPRNKKYEDELEHMREIHPEMKVTYHKTDGVSSRMSDSEKDELENIAEALKYVEVIEV